MPPLSLKPTVNARLSSSFASCGEAAIVRSWMLAHCSPFILSRDDCKPFNASRVQSVRSVSRIEKRSLVEKGSLSARYGLDVDAAASATVSVLSSSERSPVEPCFEFLAVLLLPLVHGDTVLLLYPVSVPFGYDVERAEGNDPHVRCQVVNVAAL